MSESRLDPDEQELIPTVHLGKPGARGPFLCLFSSL
jgi:hypothetical protein